MSQDTAVLEMPKPKKPEQAPVDDGRKSDDKAVKILRRLADKAKIIADSRGISISEYLSPIIAPAIEEDWPAAVEHFETD